MSLDGEGRVILEKTLPKNHDLLKALKYDDGAGIIVDIYVFTDSEIAPQVFEDRRSIDAWTIDARIEQLENLYKENKKTLDSDVLEDLEDCISGLKVMKKAAPLFNNLIDLAYNG